jgi:hypothetical protein
MPDHTRRDSDTLTGKISSLWPMLVALVSVIVMATTMKNKLDDHETRLSRLENSMGTIQADTDRLVSELLDKK